MAVGESRAFSAPQWPSSHDNKACSRKVGYFKKLNSYEAYCKLHDTKDITESSHAFLAENGRLKVSSRCVPSSAICTKPPRLSLSASLFATRLSKEKSEKLDYSNVLLKETDWEKTMRERLIHELNQPAWVKDQLQTHLRSSLSHPRLLNREINTRVLDVNKNLSYRSSVRMINPKPKYCDRPVHRDKGEFSKQFCDVLGPALCSDCTRSQMQQSVIDEQVKYFPDICVSPYVLCAPQDNETQDAKMPSSTYGENDPLQRRLPSRILPTQRKDGLKTRPNSPKHNSVRFNNGVILTSGGSLSESPIGMEFSSRRSSISKCLMACKNSALYETESGSNEDKKNLVSSRNARLSAERSESKSESAYSADSQVNNFFGKTSRRARDTTKNGRKKSSISRTGKLSELPYWRILIPEPPMMEVERMNVSIYTPKEIPGIKIFDESFFDI
ncbi:uncharacterized protein [Montipora foliosa]|uniref:uncharacterized protein n=1 Tax=Montipora foliosa TaxID=591990 RepID=UPI0035F15C89